MSARGFDAVAASPTEPRSRCTTVLGPWLAVALLLVSESGFAQQAELSVGRGPHYVGVPTEMQVVAEGFEDSPEPAIAVDPPEGATLELVGASPSVSTSVQVINGRMTRSRRVRFVYRYRFLPQRPGRVSVGPFRLTQATSSAQTRAVTLPVEPVPASADHRIRLILPDGPVWIGQRVPVIVEWRVAERSANAIVGRNVRVPLFERVDAFMFENEEDPDARNSLIVDTPSGSVELPATVRREASEGESYLVLTARRQMLPLKSGRIEILPATIVVEQAVRFRRDFFGERIPTAVRRVRAEDQARTLVVEAPPAEGRPASFSGAVGQGFSIEVSAERSVVQVGDPIRLSLVVRGDAALETVSLPPLAASGLDPTAFRAPDEAVAGSVEDGAKRFEITVRVVDESVREIPPIELSWFDPERGQYETTRSRPIALSVRRATVVSAAHVVRRPESVESEASPVPSAVETASARPRFTLSGAELSIETRPEALFRAPTPALARPVVQGTLYAIGLLALGVAVLARRRASMDPAAVARIRQLEAERRSIAGAGSVADLAQALRRMVAVSDGPTVAGLEALLRECDDLVYAPGGGGRSPVATSMKQQAASMADALLEAAR